MSKQEEFQALQTRQIDAAMKLAQFSMNNAERLMALQIEAARAIFDETAQVARAMASAKAPQDALAAQQRIAQDGAGRLMGYARQVGEMTAEAHSELTRLLGEQWAENQRGFMEAMKNLGVPESANLPPAFGAMQPAFEAAQAAFGQMAQATMDAMQSASGAARAIRKR